MDLLMHVCFCLECNFIAYSCYSWGKLNSVVLLLENFAQGVYLAKFGYIKMQINNVIFNFQPVFLPRTLWYMKGRLSVPNTKRFVICLICQDCDSKVRMCHYQD